MTAIRLRNVAYVALGLCLVLVIVFCLGTPLLLRYAHEARCIKESRLTAPETGYRFPNPDDIALMTVVQWHREAEDPVGFDVPKECWSEVIDALSPSQSESPPRPWVILGDMEILLKNGDTCVINLYCVSSDPAYPQYERLGAFSAGSDRRSRGHYRGGSTRELKAALERAYMRHQEAAKTQSGNQE